jgi:hypothetical protein
MDWLGTLSQIACFLILALIVKGNCKRLDEHEKKLKGLIDAVNRMTYDKVLAELKTVDRTEDKA